MQENNIFFNIIVPTKNRISTLKFTLKTIFNQNYKNYRVIILDNNSNDGTEEYIKSLNNNFIVYDKSHADLRMNENWERAWKHCNNGYVTVVGDDDGLFPNALNELNNFLKINKTEIISWFPNCYHWTNVENNKKNNVEIYFGNENKFSKYESRKILQKVLDMSILYLDSPMIYNSFVNVNLINKIRNKKKNNIFFSNGIPDVYSGLILLLNSQSYYKANFPVGLVGISNSSLGANLSKKDKSSRDIIKNMEYFNIKRVPPIPSYYLSVLEPFDEICEDFNEYKKYLINFHRLKIRVESEISNESQIDKKFYKDKLKTFINEYKQRYSKYERLKIFLNLFKLTLYNTFEKVNIKLEKKIDNIYDASIEIQKQYNLFINDKNYKNKFLDKKLYFINVLRKLGVYNICLTIFKINKIFN